MHKLVTRDLGLAAHAPMLAFHGRHQRQQAIWRPLVVGFILEQLPQRFGSCVGPAPMTDLVEIDAREK